MKGVPAWLGGSPGPEEILRERSISVCQCALLWETKDNEDSILNEESGCLTAKYSIILVYNYVSYILAGDLDSKL